MHYYLLVMIICIIFRYSIILNKIHKKKMEKCNVTKKDNFLLIYLSNIDKLSGPYRSSASSFLSLNPEKKKSRCNRIIVCLKIKDHQYAKLIPVGFLLKTFCLLVRWYFFSTSYNLRFFNFRLHGERKICIFPCM